MADLAVELKKLGHSVTVLSTTPHYNLDQTALARQPLCPRWGGLVFYSDFHGIPVWHVKLPLKGQRVWTRAIDYLRFHALSVLLCLKAIGPQDVVIATSPPLTIGIMSWLLAARWGAASVYKVAEVYPDLAVRQGLIRSPLLIGIMRWMERVVYRRNSMIVPIAESFKSVISERGVPARKLRMIPDCVDTELYRPLPRQNAFAEKYDLLAGFVVLYGGNIGLVQDWTSVLAAAEALKDLPIKFVIVGDGARREWLAGEVKRRGLVNFQMIGYQPKELMAQINASCDLGLIPMTRTGAQDGFPSKVYAIMACAKPVLATAEDGSEMAWIIKAAGCGRVVAPDRPQAFTEAVRVAFQDREKLPDEGLRGRRFVEKDYSKEAIARKYDLMIKELVRAR
jgi:glycosyltransferase involved in cell wall biosynthesis